MSFQTKLLITYSLLIIVLGLIFSIGYFAFSVKSAEESANKNLIDTSERMMMQLDNLITLMDFITIDIFSQSEFIPSLATLTYFDRKKPENNKDIVNSMKTVQDSLYKYSLLRNFYRIGIFNDKGDFFTSRFERSPIREERRVMISDLSWIDSCRNKNGRLVIIPPYEDPWVVAKGKKVFGVARVVLGTSEIIGYLEVQNLYSHIETILSAPPGEVIQITALTGEGLVLYNNDQDTASFSDRILSSESESEYTGIRLILKQDRQYILRLFYRNAGFMLTISMAVILVSVIFIYLFSIRLTRPIRDLFDLMEETELVTLPEQINLKSSNNEFESLGRSFLRLRSRLNEAVQREIKSSALQIQASFDALQAQINPHFMFNILNVLSNMGLESGNEEICRICDGIASMLRYSTSTKDSRSTFREEVEHLSNYLILMKNRYEHKLEFTIDVDSVLMDLPIPKITLQPLVENCINHGFTNNSTTMVLSIRGWRQDKSWFLEILDNGQGFNKETLVHLIDSIKKLDRKLWEHEDSIGFNVGGLGLINTYARLCLFYNEKITLEISNCQKGGAMVIIGGKILKEEL